MCLARHLAYRSALLDAEARKAIRGLDFGFKLYPKKPGSNREQKAYGAISEYFLMMKNLCCAQRYTEFILRLNPFTVRLQECLLTQLLEKHLGVTLAELKTSVSRDRFRLDPERMRQSTPELLKKLNEMIFHTDADVKAAAAD